MESEHSPILHSHEEDDAARSSKTSSSSTRRGPSSFFLFLSSTAALITCEPLVATYAFGAGAFSPVFQELLRNRTCSHMYDDCAHPNASESLALQGAWAEWNALATVIELLPSVLVNLSVGAWSDRYGRRLPLIVPCIGMCLAALNMLAIDHWPQQEAAPFFLLFLSPLVQSCSGGFVTLVTVSLAYAADVSSADARTVRFALVATAFSVGSGLGSLVASQMIGSDGTRGVARVYYLLLGSGVASLLYALLRIRETVVAQEHGDDAWREKLLFLCRFRHVADGVRAIARPREGGVLRRRIGLMLGASAMIMFAEGSESPIQQPFLESPPFSWSLAYYMRIGAVRTFLGCLAVGLVVPMCKRVLHWRDTSLGLVGCLSGVLYFLGFGVAALFSTPIVFAACGLGLLQMLALIAARSIISDSIARDEQAQVFAVFSGIEATSILVGSVFFSVVFRSTIHLIWSGFCFMLSAYLFAVALAIFCWVDVEVRRDVNRL